MAYSQAQASELLEEFRAKEASLDMRTGRRVRRDRRRARLPELRRRLKLLAPAFDTTPAMSPGASVGSGDRGGADVVDYGVGDSAGGCDSATGALGLSTPTRRLLPSLASAPQLRVPPPLHRTGTAASLLGAGPAGSYDTAGEGSTAPCEGCDRYSGSSVGSAFDESSGYVLCIPLGRARRTSVGVGVSNVVCAL